MNHGLASVSIIERDVNGDVLFVWGFPTVADDLVEVLKARCGLDAGVALESKFVYGKYRDTWHYTWTTGDKLPNKYLPQVTSFALIITSKIFNPEKYAALLKVLAASYSSRGDTGSVLEGFLSVTTTGKFANESGSWSLETFDDKAALLAGTSITEICSAYGLEVALIWNALALKKRVIISADSLDIAQKVVRTLPQLVWHRQDWGILRPHFTSISPLEVSDLKRSGVYVVGTTDSSFKGREELYDLFIDASAQKIIVAEHAKNDFKLGSVHKSIAGFLLDSLAAKTSDKEIIQGLVARTKEVRNSLTALSGGSGPLTLEALREKKMAPHNENFLWQFAVAENLASK